MIANRFNPLGKRLGKLTAKDYIQDGLVSMWDGIENVGWGEHDSSTKVWKDLIGSDDLTCDAASWDDVSFITKRGTPMAARRTSKRNPYGDTIELCARIDTKPDSNSAIGAVVALNPYPAGGYISKLAVAVRYTGALVFGLRGASNLPYCYTSSSLPSSMVGIPFTASKYADPNSDTGTAYFNGKRIKLDVLQTGECSSNYNMTLIGSAWTTTANGHFCCVRRYNRELTDKEAEWNDYVDKVRFNTIFSVLIS